MKRGALVLAGALALVVGLVLYLPATVVSGWAESAVPGLDVTGVSGTALEGRAARVYFGDSPPLQDVRWQVRPWALLAGRAAVDVRVPTDAGELSGIVFDPLFGAAGLGLENVAGQASIGWLAGLGGYRFMPVGGRIRVDIARARLNAGGLPTAIAGTAAVENLHWRLLNPPLPLGAATVRLAAADGAAIAEVVDSDGPLAIAGYTRLAADGVYRLDLRLRSRSDARLARVLSNLGRADADGWHRVVERGRL